MKINKNEIDWYRDDVLFDDKGKRWIVSHRMKRVQKTFNFEYKFWLEVFQIDNDNKIPTIKERYPNKLSEVFHSSDELYEESERIIRIKKLK